MRGVRIELEEIESATLRVCPFVSQSAACVRAAGEVQKLVLYVVPQPQQSQPPPPQQPQPQQQQSLPLQTAQQQSLPQQQPPQQPPAADSVSVAAAPTQTQAPPATLSSRVLHALRQVLPTEAVPSVVVSLPVLPYTAHGKLDRTALCQLPVPDSAVRASAGMESVFVAPRTPLEGQLAAVCARILRVPAVSVCDNFFELGGTSMLAMRLAGALAAAAGLNVAASLILSHPTMEVRICVFVCMRLRAIMLLVIVQ